ncbi:unnamed protein product [Tilletia laevis]|uniref:AB hydrolase-1 domain-containing protein n=1 Tax=Tilletia caries TaxID=13290 RepID=A0A177TXT6_9BASI|nr:hypothetical protein CF335_g7331 [Tilletia laevis]KAE8246210.1 hypothetical protein A4X03_0g7298 [Tilletia caries]KAE8196236.1 hypothetical protein CF336_g2724 [Tilletia laevis]CAD6884691.1 unnamed protein product [Tilletia caries]CAD6897964.1 unnamed protein product [Tilletia laevis]
MQISFAFLSLLAVTNAAVVYPRQAADAATTTAVMPSTAIGVDATGEGSANETDTSSNARCTRQTYQVPVNVTQPSYDTLKMGVEPEVNQTRITELFVEYVTSSQNFTQAYLNGSVIVEQTFNISGVYCEPKNNNTVANSTIQLLVHGIGFDSSYWNIQSSEYNLSESTYSYVYQAHEAGYPTFRYDRLGTGQSERPADGYNLVQASTEAAILENLAERIRNTTDIGGRAWNQTVVVGHSYGSAQSQHLSQVRPELIDALVLTGFSIDFTGFPFTLLSGVYTQAGTVFPERFANISKHWLVTGTQYADQINFAYPASVTSNATTWVRGTAAPVTQGAFFTIGGLGAPAQNYTGPVQVVLGEKDFIFAFRNPYVNGTDFATQAIEALFPQAAEGSEGSIIPATGHGINYHTTAPLAYNATLSFLNVTLFNATAPAGPSSLGNDTLPTATDNSTTPIQLPTPSGLGDITLPTTVAPSARAI